ncbi:MAG: SAM hydroxide adenosyltransferase [Verrucomicrobiota bacterium]
MQFYPAHVFFVALLGLLASSQAQERLTGEIEGAKYVIELPAEPSGKLLLLAHGYRPEGLPLDADIGSSHQLFSDLVDEGWAVASTSYRRNGWIMEDAAKDLINLRDFIIQETSFEPTHVFLMGNSMGGGISTWIAEHAPEGFDGALAMGAYLFEPIQPEAEPSTQLASYYSGAPKFPILYLTNVSELDGPAAYLDLAAEAEPNPLIWFVDREGHVNQNEAEQRAGLFGLVDWVKTGEAKPYKDGTVEMNPDSTAKLATGKAIGEARILVPVYGNFITSFVRSDLDALELEQGDFFSLSASGKTVDVMLGSTYTDVPVGDWVAFWDAEGYLLICRNYKHAVDSLGVSKGDPITIHLKESL